MKKFNLLRLELAEKHLTPAEKKKREEIAMAMERENPGMLMGKKMAIATAAAKKVAEENLDELKSSTLDSYIDKVATGPSRGNTQTGIPKSIKAIGGVTTAIRKKVENDNPPFEPNMPKGERKDQFGNPIKNVAKHLAKQGMKSVTEEVKTTHEDPLVVTKDSEGNIHTHANLSVANAIHGTDVKHQAIHTGMPIQSGKWTFQISKHHSSAVKEEVTHTFEPVQHQGLVKNKRGHSFVGNTYNAKGLKGASIYKHKDTGKFYADRVTSTTTYHDSAEEAGEKYHSKAKKLRG